MKMRLLCAALLLPLAASVPAPAQEAGQDTVQDTADAVSETPSTASETPEAAAPASGEDAPASVEDAPAEKVEPAKETEPAEEAAAPASVIETSPGQADLDKATELKIAAESPRDLNEVIRLLDSAIEDGLDEANQKFAESMLAATLMQRAAVFSRAILERPVPDPRRDPQWVRVRSVALSDLQRVVELDNSVVEAYLLIGRLQSLPYGDPGAAKRALSKVIRAEAVEPERLAQAYALRGATQTEDAKRLEDFSKAVELVPEKTEYYLLRARTQLKLKDYDAALADIDKLIELEPEDVKYLILRSRANQQKGDIDAALADVEKADELSPENGAVYQQKGILLRVQGKQEEALAALEKATELAPKNVMSYQLRGELFAQQGDLDGAIDELTKAVQLSPENEVSRLVRAELYMREQRWAEALSDVEFVLRKQPNALQPHLMRTALLAQLDRKDEAIAALERLSQAAPGVREIHLQLSSMYMDRGEYEDAIGSLSTVIGLDEADQVALRLRGDMYLSIGKHEEALADFGKSLEIDPDDTGVLNNYAWTLATSPFDNLRDGQRAVELATKAAELTDFQAAHILSTLAAAYAEAGDFEKAMEWSEKAVKTHASDEKKTRDMSADLAAELESYKRREPWRELQQLDQQTKSGAAPDAGEVEGAGFEADAVDPIQSLDF